MQEACHLVNYYASISVAWLIKLKETGDYKCPQALLKVHLPPLLCNKGYVHALVSLILNYFIFFQRYQNVVAWFQNIMHAHTQAFLKQLSSVSRYFLSRMVWRSHVSIIEQNRPNFYKTARNIRQILPLR